MNAAANEGPNLLLYEGADVTNGNTQNVATQTAPVIDRIRKEEGGYLGDDL